jgi:pyruvyltransferase
LRQGHQVPQWFGDGALVLPTIYKPKKTLEFGKIGLIRHVSHEGQRLVEDGITEISLSGVGTQFITSTIDEIASCELIASTSLHGLIVAVAFGIPAVYCDISQAKPLSGDGMKFEDFFQSLGIRNAPKLDLGSASVITRQMLQSAEPLGTPKWTLDVVESFWLSHEMALATQNGSL